MGAEDKGEARMLRQEARAVEQRWPIPPEWRRMILARAMRTIANPNASERSVNAAMRIMTACEKQNQIDDLASRDNPTDSSALQVQFYIPENELNSGSD